MAGLLLYYITDRSQFPGDEPRRREELLSRIAAAAHAGVDYIQLREKDLSGRDLEALARAAVQRIRSAGTLTRLLINARTDIALAAGADGVHLPANDISAADARRGFVAGGGVQPVIAVSCHAGQEIESARDTGADFAVLGPVFEKLNGEKPSEKSDATGVGVERLHEVCAAANGFPVLALGGVTLENARECLRAGTAGIAGIRLFQQDDLDRTVAALRRIG